jgi:hypothetical protein
VERLGGLKLAAGDVLLFHDDGPRALDALEIMLPRWATSGLRFGQLTA